MDVVWVTALPISVVYQSTCHWDAPLRPTAVTISAGGPGSVSYPVDHGYRSELTRAFGDGDKIREDITGIGMCHSSRCTGNNYVNRKKIQHACVD